MSYNLLKYYFQDIHLGIMDGEIMRGMQGRTPRTFVGGN
jgi:hypothetical protein